MSDAAISQCKESKRKINGEGLYYELNSLAAAATDRDVARHDGRPPPRQTRRPQLDLRAVDMTSASAPWSVRCEASCHGAGGSPLKRAPSGERSSGCTTWV